MTPRKQNFGLLNSDSDKPTEKSLPRHVAIIMDGNGRWARRQFRPRVWGHRRGVERVKQVVEAAAEIGVESLTLFAFSEENWARPSDEVNTLMGLLNTYLAREMQKLQEKNIRFRAIGDLSRLPDASQKLLRQTIKATEANTRMTLTLALSYSGRSEIVHAAKKIATLVERGDFTADQIDQQLFGKFLESSELPELDLMIRTSGEFRVSNFLLWQLAYAELYFTPVFWPDFTREHFEEAIADYQGRQRRFGRVEADVQESFELSSETIQ